MPIPPHRPQGAAISTPFDPLLDRVHQHASTFLRDLQHRFVGARASRDELIAALDAPLPQHGEDPAAVIDLLTRHAERGTSACASPRCFGFVIGSSLPVTLAADWLVSTWDQNAGIHIISPITSAIEEVAARWLLELFDLTRESLTELLRSQAWSQTPPCIVRLRPI